MVLRCKPPRLLNIYAAVYGRSLGETDTCPSHLTRPPPFGESTGYSAFSYGGSIRVTTKPGIWHLKKASLRMYFILALNIEREWK